MKVITTNLLDRFWKNGVKPIKDALATKFNLADVVNNLTTTVAGKALDARQGKILKDGLDELNRNYIVEEGENNNGHYRKWSNGSLEMWGEAFLSGVNITNQDGWNYYAPIHFITFPIKSLTYGLPIISVRGGVAPWGSIPDTGIGNEGFNVWVYASTQASGQNIWVTWKAYGTWK